MISNGIKAVSEGANMPTEQDGIHAFLDAKVLFGPSKAANAGGVAVSGLEITQNLQRLSWTSDDLQKQLKSIMHSIHDQCVEYGKEGNENFVDYVKGANLAGFIKVANAMIAYGVV